MATTADVHRQYTGSIVTHDWEKLKDLIHPEYIYTGVDGSEQAGPDAPLASAQMFAAAFPDLHVDIRAIYTSGDVAIAELIVSGTHQGDLFGIPPTDKQMTVPSTMILEVRDGKIYREREYYDLMSMLTQLGVVSPPGEG